MHGTMKEKQFNFYLKKDTSRLFVQTREEAEVITERNQENFTNSDEEFTDKEVAEKACSEV